MKTGAKIIAVLGLLALCSVGLANEFRVPSQYPTIQAAINATNSGDTVLVANGTYTGDRDIDFKGKAITVRSEDGPNNCIIDCEYSGRSFYFHSSEDANSILDGFTITNGLVYGDINEACYGGGMYNSGGSPTIINCIFSGNEASGGYTNCGGGMYNSGGSPTIINCTFCGNLAYVNQPLCVCLGGGMYSEGGNPTITNCTFSGNSADAACGGNNGGDCGYGGGLYNDSNTRVTNCTFSGNLAHGYRLIADGGGIDNEGIATIINCTFSGNSVVSAAESSGGGMMDGGSIAVTNCTFSGNLASSGGSLGGGMWCFDAVITNCKFSGNSALSSDGNGYGYGGGMYGDSGTITNCTFSGNRAYGGHNSYGGGVYCYYGVIATNCILYGNTALDGNEIAIASWGTVDVSYSDVKDGNTGVYEPCGGLHWGPGTINADPCFVKCGYWGDANDPNIHREPNDMNAIWIDGNYRLLSGSPCIDAGDNYNYHYAVSSPFDLDGFPRFIDDLCTADTGYGKPPIVDMGAYEFLRADINHDGAVNFTDFALLALQWLKTGCGQCCGADLTCDGQVNWADLREFAKWWLAGGSN